MNPTQKPLGLQSSKVVLLLPDVSNPRNGPVGRFNARNSVRLPRKSIVLKVDRHRHLSPSLCHRHMLSTSPNSFRSMSARDVCGLNMNGTDQQSDMPSSSRSSTSSLYSNSLNSSRENILLSSSKSSISSSNYTDRLTSKVETTEGLQLPHSSHKSKQQRTHGICSHCGPATTAEWRQGPYGLRTLCNSCGTYYNKLINTIISVYTFSRLEATRKANLIMYYMKFKVKRTDRESRRAIKKIPYEDEWESQVKDYVPFPLDADFFVITEKSHDRNGVRKVRTRNSKSA